MASAAGPVSFHNVLSNCEGDQCTRDPRRLRNATRVRRRTRRTTSTVARHCTEVAGETGFHFGIQGIDPPVQVVRGFSWLRTQAIDLQTEGVERSFNVIDPSLLRTEFWRRILRLNCPVALSAKTQTANTYLVAMCSLGRGAHTARRQRRSPVVCLTFRSIPQTCFVSRHGL